MASTSGFVDATLAHDDRARVTRRGLKVARQRVVPWVKSDSTTAPFLRFPLRVFSWKFGEQFCLNQKKITFRGLFYARNSSCENVSATGVQSIESPSAHRDEAAL